tara:strand:- start:8931 stop:9785 length:855 start_codon:yes stop_codon:yes gene_type:complete
MQKKLILIAIYLFVINCSSSIKEITKDSVYDSFGVVYSDVNPVKVAGYKLLIVEPYFYSREDILEFHSRGIKVIAYLSLGEVNESRRYFEEFKSIGLKGKNENHGSYYIDLSKKRVKDKFLKQIVPELFSYGYDGLFLDTIDAVAPYTVRRNMEQDMVELIKGIKLANPSKILIQNAGFFLLDQTSEYVNAVAIEDIASGYNFDTNEYLVKSEEEFQERLKLVDSMFYAYQIPFLIIDFEPVNTTNELLRSRLDKAGYPYFISNIGFDGLPIKPKSNTKLKKGV